MTATAIFDQFRRLAVARNIGWILMAVSAIAIALYAVPRTLTFDPALSRIPINPLFDSHKLWLAFHALTGGLALVIGPFQFMTAFRTRWPTAHRIAGKAYLVCVLLAGMGALSSTIMTTAGIAAQVAFGLLNIGWMYSTYTAYRAARQLRFAVHRIWMIRSYALTFAAVLLRVFLMVGIVIKWKLFPAAPFDQIYTASLWSSFVVSLLFAEWFIIGRNVR